MAENVGQRIRPSALESTPAANFPATHRSFLTLYNGLTCSHGAYRIFGIGRESTLDLLTWNRSESWRFAWDERVAPYYSFGETAWGDQYAYRWSAAGGGFEAAVYFLEATLLRAEVLAPSFDRFLVDELGRVAQSPYDAMTAEALDRFGGIDVKSHWVYTPSLALGGVESIENVAELPAFVAMTFAGDIATALEESPPDLRVAGVVPWTDDHGRPRLKVSLGRDLAARGEGGPNDEY